MSSSDRRYCVIDDATDLTPGTVVMDVFDGRKTIVTDVDGIVEFADGSDATTAYVEGCMIEAPGNAKAAIQAAKEEYDDGQH